MISLTNSVQLPDGPIFLLRGGGRVGQFSTKNYCTASNSGRGAIGKNRVSDFYYSSPIFDAEKITAQAFAHKRNVRGLKVRKIFHAPENCGNTLPPRPSKIIMLRPKNEFTGTTTLHHQDDNSDRL